MGIRDILKQREEARDKAQSGGDSGNFPEGVTRYVRMGKFGEVNAEGRTFAILAKPDDWYAYFVHEDKVYEGKTIHKFRKHTCLHSPKSGEDNLLDYFKSNKDECISCKVGAKRKLFFMIPVYDPEYDEYRVIDTAEFHANNLIADYDKYEKTMQKATKNKEYSIVGEAIFVKQVDKSYSLESGDLEDAQLEAAEKFIGIDYGYVDLANFREESDIVEILKEAQEGSIDKTKLPGDAAEDSGNELADEEGEKEYDF